MILAVMLTLYAACGANLDSPAPVPVDDLEQVAALARTSADLVYQHLHDCPCGGVRVTTWSRARVISDVTIGAAFLDDHACAPCSG